MSDPASPPPPVAQVNDTGIDFTTLLPLEVMVHLLEVGAFELRQLAPLRLVNRALRDAASDPSLYRAFECEQIVGIDALPPFVTDSLHRLDVRGIDAIDLGKVATLVPNLTSLAALRSQFKHADDVNNLNLRELSMDAASREGDMGKRVGFLDHFVNLECLQVARLDHASPIDSLPLLRRLDLHGYQSDVGALLSALASAPLAATLEAFRLELWFGAKMTPGWWEPLADLSSLRELSLVVPTEDCPAAGDDADAFADILANHPTLAVLSFRDSDAVTAAMLRRGFPSNLKVLRATSWTQGVDELVAALPTGLLGLQITTGGRHGAADVHALLSRCPQLGALDLNCNAEAIAYLLDSGSVDRSLGFKRAWFGQATVDALTAAGHRVGELFIGVHWRIAGGVVFDGKAAAVW